jgi:serine/threonine protein kinase
MSHCATVEQLERFLSDQLERPEWDMIATHIEECDSCQQILDQLTRSRESAQLSPSNREEEDRIARLLERVRAKGPHQDDHEDRPHDEDLLRSSPKPEACPRIDGLRIIREIGRGGMGIVYEAEDQRLNRRVALKVLLFKAPSLPKQVERFEREARAAARLHHTNIVPVFGVGEQEGQHYYLMQYIEGFGLDVVLDELRRIHEPAPLLRQTNSSEMVKDPGRSDSSEPPGIPCPVGPTVTDVATALAAGQFSETASLPIEDPSIDAASSETDILSPPITRADPPRPDRPPAFLPGSGKSSMQSDRTRSDFQAVVRIGIQVAEAMEYANRQGILHRDIKPSNLLLDSRGNVWVTDFGLAKTIDADELTSTGDILGTVRYMAPERFEGKCDARGDVYSLGLSLYELASRRPAFEETDRFKLIDRIRTEGPPRLRTVAPKVPGDLETIIHKAIAREPDQRYPTAGALAEDLGRFREGRTILARRASLSERTLRWCKRNPWAAASIFILIVGTVVSGWQAFRATRAERTARSATEATIEALGKAESETARATQAETATRMQRDRAQVEAERFKAVSEFLRKDMLAQASVSNQPTRDSPPDSDLKVRTALDRAAARIGDRFASQPLVEASIRQTIGETYQQLGLFSQARPHLERALELSRVILGDEAPETFSVMHSLGVLLEEDGKWTEAERYMVPAMQGLRKVRALDDPETLEAMADVGNLYNELGRAEEAESLLSQSVKGLRRTRGERDILTLRTMDDLAVVYLARNEPVKAEQLEKEAIEGMRRWLGDKNPYTLLARRNLASIYSASNKGSEAEELWKDVLQDLRQVLGDKHPDTLYTLVAIAAHYIEHNKLDEVEKYAREALEGSRSVLNDKHQTRMYALGFLANVYGGQRDSKKLEPVLIETVQLARFRWGPDNEFTAGGDTTAGLFLISLGKYSEAEGYCREEAEFRIRHNPDRKDRFGAELRLGISLLAQKKVGEARSRLLSAYNGLRPSEKIALPADTSDLGQIVEQILQLHDEAGKPWQDASLARLRGDPLFQGIIVGLQFPADPFVDPSVTSPGFSAIDRVPSTRDAGRTPVVTRPVR